MTDTLSKTLATSVLTRRKALHMTQAQLASHAGITVESVARLERVLTGAPSAQGNPTLDTMDRIATALDCTVVDLLRGGKPRATKAAAAVDSRKMRAIERIVKGKAGA